jgi:hypothetical protein
MKNTQVRFVGRVEKIRTDPSLKTFGFQIPPATVQKMANRLARLAEDRKTAYIWVEKDKRHVFITTQEERTATSG